MGTTKLKDKGIVTTMNTNDTVPLVFESGAIVRIKKADLAESLRSVMATATTEKNGLMSTAYYSRLRSISFCNGTPGGNQKTWVNIGSFKSDPYNPGRFLIDTGVYYATSGRNRYDITMTCHIGTMYVNGGGTNNNVGYVVDGSYVYVYIAVSPSYSVVGMFISGVIGDVKPSVTEEPEGIVYV